MFLFILSLSHFFVVVLLTSEIILLAAVVGANIVRAISIHPSIYKSLKSLSNLTCCFDYSTTEKISMQIISLADLNVLMGTHC